MEHFRSPFDAGDFASPRAIENRESFDQMLDRAKRHRFFSHAFISSLGDAVPSPEIVSFILTSFYKVVAPFTGLLCTLGGQAPNLRSRFALMDNLYEELGCGDLNAAHPSLYLRMLASVGVTEKAAESLPTLPSIRRINDHLRDVVTQRPFCVACAVLASAEATILPSFPTIANLARRTFRDVDLTFFERHGARDEGHSDDAAMLFTVSADSSQFALVEAHVGRDLDYRSELLDEWMSAIADGRVPRLGDRPSLAGASPAAPSRQSAPPPPS